MKRPQLLYRPTKVRHLKTATTSCNIAQLASQCTNYRSTVYDSQTREPTSRSVTPSVIIVIKRILKTAFLSENRKQNRNYRIFGRPMLL